ncbi:MAG: hypothetical protein ACREA9_23310, partial [Pyrinomonadaceae bacterium]
LRTSRERRASSTVCGVGPPQSKTSGFEMKLLHAIYASPVELLDKARCDGRALTEALSVCDKPAVRDSLFNFAISAYHLCDWIKAYRPELAGTVTTLLGSSVSLGACRDLCNASKHVVLTFDSGPYLKHPSIVDAVTISATAKASLPEMKDVLGQAGNQGTGAASRPSWRLKIQMKNGHRIATEELVAEVIDVWEKFFADNHIQ